MIGEEVTIIIYDLPQVLQPNAVHATWGGRMMKASATKRLRKYACECVEEAQVETAPWDYVEVQATFYFKHQRTRDPDNANASLKAAYDGIVDAGLVEDDDWGHMKRLPPIQRIDSDCPRVELKIVHTEPMEEYC